MKPVLNSGDLIVSKHLKPEEYKVGDVISFIAFYRGRYLVTHRISGKSRGVNGEYIFKTKGDANTNGDPWVLRGDSIIGKQTVAVPWLGFLLLKLKNPRIVIVLGLISALLIILPDKKRVLAERQFKGC